MSQWAGRRAGNLYAAIRHLAGALSALALSAMPAAADVTAEDVWDNLSALTTALGGTLGPPAPARATRSP